MEQDPVCGMYMIEVDDRLSTEFEGRLYYFCCPCCKKNFDKEPQRFIKILEEKGLKIQRRAGNEDINII